MKRFRVLPLLTTAVVLLTGFKENSLDNKINAAPRVSIANVSVVEGNQGQRTAEVMVIISEATNPVTITYTTRNGTALAGSDYVAAKGSLDFAAGQRMMKIAVLINGDVDCEQDETFEIVLSNAGDAISTEGMGIVTIVNDDCLHSSKSAGGNNKNSHSAGGNSNSAGNNSKSAGNNSNNSNSVGSSNNTNLSVYEVRLTYTGYTAINGTAADCGIRSNGLVTLTGLLSGAENDDPDDVIMYTGVLQLDIDMDICSAQRLPNGEDRLCGITVLGCGPVKTELELDSTGTGYGWMKFNSNPSLGRFQRSVVGGCDPQQMVEEENMVPNETKASIFNGIELPLPTHTLRVGRYVKDEVVVEILRKIQ